MWRCCGVATLLLLLGFCSRRIHALAADVRCGHPAVPLNCRVTLSSADLQLGTTASYSCDEGYELFGSPTLVCSPSGAWQGELPFCGTNVALRRPANQSTTVRGGAAANGNDGDATTVHDGRRCTETMKEASPWWAVDLLRPYGVKAVRVTTRGCCGHQPLKDIEIRVGNSSSDLQRNPLCAWFPGTIEEGVTKTFTCARTLVGQHVFLQLVGVEGSLSVCEVEVFTTDEFSDDRCAPPGSAPDVELASFERTCYEFSVARGGSFSEARASCQAHGGDLAHGLQGAAATFLLQQLERRKPRLKTQLVWVGAQRDPGFTSRTWRWVNGEVVVRPAWGKDQPNNYNGEQNCVVLDGGRNWLWNDVGCGLDYLHWVCQRPPSDCGSPDKLLNTTVTGGNYSVGAAVTYHCPEGHKLVGDQNRTCTSGGLWSSRAPSCQYVDCGGVPSLEHGAVLLASNRTTHGASARYSCHENYTLIGKEERTCGDDGLWSGEAPQCLFDWCPEPPAVHGGTVETKGRRAGSTALYTCQSGFILFGQPVLSCGLGGEWSGKAPSCRFVDCGAPPLPDKGRYSLLNASTAYGSLAQFSCDDDHWLDGTELQTCTREGRWSADAPSCVLITCDEPEVPSGGYVVGYDFNVHSSIEYHCDVGHILRGQAVHECTLQGEWSGEPPTCEYVDCGKLPPMPYGSVMYVNKTTYLGSEVHYNCTRHYRLAGASSRVCQENGLWSGESPRCEEIRCPEPVVPEHSILSVTNNDRVYGRTLIRTPESAASSVATYKINSLLKYRCERGYKIVGEPLSTCEEGGRWSGEVPRCTFVDCGVPEELAHGRFTLASNATYYGVAVLYECDPHFQLDGHGRRLCLDNGTWSSDTPACREILCAEPETTGGVTVEAATRSVGGIAVYSCPRGQYMVGNSTRTCTGKGSWTGAVPSCKYVDCRHPGPIENGRVIITNDSTTYSSAVEYHCVPGFDRIGPYLRKCMEDGQWSGEEPRCEVTSNEVSEPQQLGMTIGIACGVVLFLLLILGLIYLRLRKATPVKNTENVQAAARKEDQSAAVMSYATLNDANGYGMPNGPNIYENIHERDDPTYDAPYEEARQYGHKSTTPRPVVTINGVAVR
ncbi:sushi, von Willebrand factor type A, EGF and pentraxin domain-containing protein 1 [Bacillus rossius redtenbacheri]|uniref:sushi, von Willebrand factor type A, EGF and pentraxin domain-containing protein 1 n=1 Tax=Bacillus rossius redtenbacheri TaxID=93214 RepID=UPI002FDCBEE6